MYDFQNTLNRANKAFENKDYAQAAYWYWEITFAYQDEEFPIYYTPEIGYDAEYGFENSMRHISVKNILESDFYTKFRELMGNSRYIQKYFLAFERDIIRYESGHNYQIFISL